MQGMVLKLAPFLELDILHADLSIIKHKFQPQAPWQIGWFLGKISAEASPWHTGKGWASLVPGASDALQCSCSFWLKSPGRKSSLRAGVRLCLGSELRLCLQQCFFLQHTLHWRTLCALRSISEPHTLTLRSVTLTKSPPVFPGSLPKSRHSSPAWKC